MDNQTTNEVKIAGIDLHTLLSDGLRVLRRTAALFAALTLLLSGCGSLLERDYSVVRPHSSTYYESEDRSVLRAESYQDLVNDLLLLLTGGAKEGTVWLYAGSEPMDASAAAERACKEVQQETPLGAYAVEYLTYTVDDSARNYTAIQLTIGYRRTPEQIASMVYTTSISALHDLLTSAARSGSGELVVQVADVKGLKQFARFYIWVFRGTPLLVQLFFIYYGFPKIGIRMSAELCGVVGLAFLGGSYMAESFRSGLESVEPIQSESAISLGMNSRQVLGYVILPQAMSTSIPAFVANIIFLLKETSVFSAISLMDLMFTAKDLIGLYYKTTESLFLLVVFYLLILLPVSVIGSLVERRMRYAGFGD